MPGSSKSFLFPDVNVWIALTYSGHTHHSVAVTWFAALDTNARLCFCRFTQISFLRLLTTEAAMGRGDVLSQTEAWQAYDQWLADHRVCFISEPAGLETTFRSLTAHSAPAPKQWADAYLAAFAADADLTIVTFDKAFRGKTKSLELLSP
jgi:toxin-antitoxin system PIN domain toxin